MFHSLTFILSPAWFVFFGLVYLKTDVWAVTAHALANLQVSAVSYIFVLCLFLAIAWALPKKVNAQDTATHSPEQEGGSGLKPLIFPARTTHSRFFPKKHSFSYSYLLIGVPIGWRGSVGSFLSVDIPLHCLSQQSIWGRPWFAVHAKDYLERAGEDLGLQGKLQSYLKTQGEDIRSYAYAYLITAPRFLGYSFNPVSFWYLYNTEKELKAMILEVNNTFDERRMYLLNGSSASPGESKDCVEEDTSSRTFRNTWTKDFHVSPFNSRKGSYTMTAHDPFSPRLSNQLGTIDNNITLKSSKAHAKLVARISSTQPGIDPTTLTYSARLRFIAAWWWVGFMTFPRIVKEAGKLFFRRKLHVWYRPEVLKESIGRQATMDEIIIERSFRPYLRALIESSSTSDSSACRLRYISPVPHPSSPAAGATFTPKTSTADPEKDEPIVFKPTTPLFYSRLVRHSHISEFLSSELLRDDNKDRTFWVSHPESFVHIFERSKQMSVGALPDEEDEDDDQKESSSSILERYGWRLLHFLRNHRPRVPLDKDIIEDGNEKRKKKQKDDIRSFDFSPLDRFTVRHLSPSQSAQYRSVVTKILVSDVVAFGHPEVMDALGYLGRVAVSWGIVRGVKYGVSTLLSTRG
ncbi:MAG: hypothetical protein LQ352_003584 [Teloschistes flavicans]|nr:MAG: hypothetical protein LQ352_003584 [Teloschistes flavicans]